jgi:hypothetical protein
MIKAWLFAGGAIGALAITVACTSSTSSGNGNGGSSSGSSCTYNLATELQLASSAGSTCASCVQNSCGSQVSAYEGNSGCGSYLSCVCPNGTATTDTTVLQQCAQQQGQGCNSAASTLSTCINTNCNSQCHSGGTSSGGTSSGGTSSGSSSGGTLSQACQKFETCCVAYYEATLGDAGAAYASTCQGIAEGYNGTTNGDTYCSQATAGYADAGVTGCQ